VRSDVEGWRFAHEHPESFKKTRMLPPPIPTPSVSAFGDKNGKYYLPTFVPPEGSESSEPLSPLTPHTTIAEDHPVSFPTVSAELCGDEGDTLSWGVSVDKPFALTPEMVSKPWRCLYCNMRCVLFEFCEGVYVLIIFFFAFAFC
jgi:hypothetical protein